MKVIRFMVNWLIIFTCPIWAIFVMPFWVVQEFNSHPQMFSKLMLRGDEWLWG